MEKIYAVLTNEQTREVEGRIYGEGSGVERAVREAGRMVGEGVLREHGVLGEWPEQARLLVLAGKGHNGADALVAACVVSSEVIGLQALVVHEGEAGMGGVTRRALGRLRESLGDRLEEMTPKEALDEAGRKEFEVVLDGWLGSGFRPPLGGAVAALIGAVNGNEGIRMRVAVDTPTGLGGDGAVFRADWTYMPGVGKASVLAREAAAHVGRVRVLPMAEFAGVEAQGSGWIVGTDYYQWLGNLRGAQAEKRAHGHVLLVAGSVNMPGAALMAGRGALYGGAGLLTIFAPMNIATRIAGNLPEAMWQPVAVDTEGAMQPEVARMLSAAAAGANALLVGPGLRMDKQTLFTVSRIVRESLLPLVVDASALREDVMAAVLGRGTQAGPVILTPHRGEYQRIIGPKQSVEDMELFKATAQRLRAVIVLKGAPTIVTDGTDVYYVPAGGPVLGRGGSGDILAGMLVALLAQHSERTALEIALAGVTWHGAAADALARERGEVAVRTTELTAYLSVALRGALA